MLSNQFRKMKCLLLLLVILVGNDLAAQKIGDTLYFNQNPKQLILIEKPQSAVHQRVFKYLLQGLDANLLRKKSTGRKGPKKNSLEGQWISIFDYKGKYYAYYPSEPFFNAFLQITEDRLIINDFNDGFVTFEIEKSPTSNSNLIYLHGKDGLRHYVTFEEMSNGIFIVRSSLSNVKKIYLVRREQFDAFPIIVNYCPDNRCAEFFELVK